MRRPCRTFLALLTTVCPVLCHASMADSGSHADGGYRAIPEAGACESCRCGQRERSKPDGPCEGPSCFCSHFVIHEPGTTPVNLLGLASLPVPPCIPGSAVGWTVKCAPQFAGRGALPVITTESSAALPLLI